MGHENIGTTHRDRVAEIVSDARRAPHTTGDITLGDYAIADEIMAIFALAPDLAAPAAHPAGDLAGRIVAVIEELDGLGADICGQFPSVEQNTPVNRRLFAAITELRAVADRLTARPAADPAGDPVEATVEGG